jgi:HAMP domain-containing protein/HPt (histidine-containing phosphotransfer) domain-containing protein/two-component sensor histidine kinase
MGYTSQKPAPQREDHAPRSRLIRKSEAPKQPDTELNANGTDSDAPQASTEIVAHAKPVLASVASPPRGAAGFAAPKATVPPLPVATPAASARWGVSIGMKLGVLICGLQLVIVSGLGVYFQREQLRALSRELEDKADTYAQLVSAQVRSAVAFEDRETAREVFDAVSSDPDLLAAVLFDQKGKALHSWGSPGSLAQSASGGVAARKVFDLPDRFMAVSPVESREGPRGTLVLEFTKSELEQARVDLQRAAVLAGGLALMFGTLLALLIAQSFARRLRSISVVAEKVAGGDLSQELVGDASRDEIGSLARSFGAMLGQIKVLIREIRERAAEEQSRLEGLVQERTAALAVRNVDMRRVLDNVDQGFLTIDRQGVMSGEQSAIVARWLGTSPASGSLWDYIDQVSPGIGANLAVGWGEVVDGFLPLELSLDQMPRSFSKGNQHFSLNYKPITDSAGQFERAVVVVSDITPTVERERAEAQQREALRLFSRLNEDRAGVLEFIAEARRLVQQITVDTPSDPRVTKRLLHTLKGNAAVFGIDRLATLCHSIEDVMADTQENIGKADRQRLMDGWADINAQMETLTGDVDSHDMTISPRDYEQLMTALIEQRPLADVRSLVEGWRLESTEVRLRRASRQATTLAERMGKGPVEVRIESNDVRLDPKIWSDVWAEFPHLIRNAVDHGLEPAAGAEAGKSQLFLRTYMDTSKFVIEVEDKGRGVNWERVRELAIKRGLPSTTRIDLERALFADGLSTKEKVEETSGRGVGMAAVAAAVQAHGGEIRVHSENSNGTRVLMSWPAEAARARSTPAPRKNSRTALKV